MFYFKQIKKRIIIRNTAIYNSSNQIYDLTFSYAKVLYTFVKNQIKNINSLYLLLHRIQAQSEVYVSIPLEPTYQIMISVMGRQLLLKDLYIT